MEFQKLMSDNNLRRKRMFGYGANHNRRVLRKLYVVVEIGMIAFLVSHLIFEGEEFPVKAVDYGRGCTTRSRSWLSLIHI